MMCYGLGRIGKDVNAPPGLKRRPKPVMSPLDAENSTTPRRLRVAGKRLVSSNAGWEGPEGERVGVDTGGEYGARAADRDGAVDGGLSAGDAFERQAHGAAIIPPEAEGEGSRHVVEVDERDARLPIAAIRDLRNDLVYGMRAG